MVFSLFRRHVLQPERRRDPRRLVIDGRIAFGGRVYPLKDWSHRGFAASGVGADHCPGDRLLLTAEIPLTDETLCFDRSEEHTSELQSLMRTSYAVFCLKQ